VYHEQTFKEQKARRHSIIAYVVLFAVFLCIFAFEMHLWHDTVRDQATTSVRTAVMDAAVQCCAIEGSYPMSIEHLEKHYGLVVNEDDYVVTYEWLGDNVPPSVVVRPR
jgi:hypothetical protein